MPARYWTYSVEVIRTWGKVAEIRIDRCERARGDRPSGGGVGTWAQVKNIVKDEIRREYWGEEETVLIRAINGFTATIFDEWVPQEDEEGHYRRCDFWIWSPFEELQLA